jgi:lysophospholipase L1-like esterase
LDFGINDAIPRALKNDERYLISELGIRLPDELNFYLQKFRKITHTKEKKFDSLYTSMLDYQKDYEGLHNNLNAPTLIVLPIAPIPQKIENTHPGVTKNIKRFNEIFRRIFADYFLETQLRSELHLNSDGIHLNPEGHFEVYKKLSTILKK